MVAISSQIFVLLFYIRRVYVVGLEDKVFGRKKKVEERILGKASAMMRICIPLDLSSRPFITPQRFLRSRRTTTLLTPSLVFSPLRSSSGTWRVLF